MIVRKAVNMARKMDKPILGVVENMSYLELPDGSRMDIFGTGGGERLAKTAGVPFLGAVPMDAIVRSGGDTGQPVVVSHPDSPVAQALCSIAEEIAAKVSVAALTNNLNPIPIKLE